MSRLGIRTRFALLAATLALGIACLVGIVGYLTLRNSVLGQAERQARDQAEQLRTLVDTGSGDRAGSEAGGGSNQVGIADRALTREFVRAGLMASVLRPSGALIQSSPGSRVLALSPSLRSQCLRNGEASQRLSTPALSTDCVRLGPAAAPLGLIVAAAPLGDAQQTLHDLATALLISIGAGILLAVGLAFAAAHRALQPARRMAETATAIRSGDLSKRIAYEGPMDELGELAGELDACFAELEAAMERQRRFVADASHQLKTPIAAMRANVELLRGWARTTPTARRAALGSLDTASRGAARVVSDLLYLAGLEQQPRRVNATVRLDEGLVNAVREAQALRPAIPIRIERIDEAEVQGDELRLQQLLVNVLDNALRVSPPRGEVQTALEASGEVARIIIGDQGPGVELDQMERIFERFYTVGCDDGTSGTSGSGTGLGLSIARSIAREHGGELTAGNRDGGGAVFRLELPLRRSSSNSNDSLRRASRRAPTVHVPPR